MRSDVTAALIAASYACPSLRLGQLISNAARAGGWEQLDVFYCPDSTILKGLQILTEQANQQFAKAAGGGNNVKV